MGKQHNTQIHIVMGMHRSGTSLISGILHKSGIVMGQNKNFNPPPSIENPKGYFENYEFRKLNDAILKTSKYSVLEWNPKFRDIEKTWSKRSLKGKLYGELTTGRSIIKLKMKMLLLNNSKRYKKWGWKDPRQMLTAEQWFKVFRKVGLLDNVKIVYIYRNPISVSLSMMKIEHIETISHGIALWYLYNKTALNSLEKYSISKYFLSIESLKNADNFAIDGLSEFLGIDGIKETYKEFYSPNLIRSNITGKYDEVKILEPMVIDLLEDLDNKASSNSPLG